MSQLIEGIVSELGKGALDSLGGSLGIEKSQAQSAASLAVPVLMKALAKNTSDSSGAEALSNALDKGHDGSILSNLAGALGSQETTSMGSAILGHVLGNKTSAVTSMISSATGLDSGKALTLVSQLAPVVMGALGKKKKEDGLDASSLASLLTNESSEADSKAPNEMGMIGKLLDSDGDGNVTDDLMNMGGSLLKSFLK